VPNTIQTFLNRSGPSGWRGPRLLASLLFYVAFLGLNFDRESFDFHGAIAPHHPLHERFSYNVRKHRDTQAIQAPNSTQFAAGRKKAHEASSAGSTIANLEQIEAHRDAARIKRMICTTT